MAEPKCNECHAIGMDNILSQDSEAKTQRGDPWFHVVYCGNCGHIYGVFAMHVMSHQISSRIDTFHPR